MVIDVVTDDRLRLLSTALLLTDLPDREQQKRPHKVHPLAEAATIELDHLRTYPCVRTVAEVSENSPFLLIVPHLLRLSWPDLRPRQGVVVEPWEEIGTLTGEGFLQSLRTFRDAVDRTNLWTTTAPAWQALADDLRGVLAERDLARFLELFWGDTGRVFVVLPNPLAPRLAWIGLYAPEAHYAVLPPPLIPLDSPEPVAFASRAVPTRSTACHELSHGPQFHARKQTSGLDPAIGEVMARTPASESFRKSHPGVAWPFSEVLLRAVQVLYLRHYEGEDAAASLVQQFGEREGLITMTAWADRLEPYLEGRQAGRYHGWEEYLPIFLTALQTDQ